MDAAPTRDDYLRQVAHENGLAIECVLQIAAHLGEREDFGALVLICEERYVLSIKQAHSQAQQR